MYKRRVGVGAGVVSYATLLSGRGSDGPGVGTPTLILDFVGYLDPATLEPGDTLDLNFAASPSPTYDIYTPDPSQPQSGRTSYFVWN